MPTDLAAALSHLRYPVLPRIVRAVEALAVTLSEPSSDAVLFAGDSLTLCRLPASSSGTCCTPATERRLREAAWEHFRLRLRDSTAPLRRFLDDSLALFRGELLAACVHPLHHGARE
ncbi:hypothetical protein HPB48_015442 [Haemaphysalis longicornis]|uniref:Uncharacterized protein n=1 Tax=Haemaphysalis longicornis TaxID=44386 RepID=A0A9J6GBS2_HAELO|nr:hypothetical protein HPB48_015442 [Haemaphysalis longicornis]